MNKKTKNGLKIISNNRKARFNYFFSEFFEAGIVLKGSEVKSLRDGKGSIADSYAIDKNGEIFLINSHIPLYRQSSYNNHNPKGDRKLLLKKKEINKLIGSINQDIRYVTISFRSTLKSLQPLKIKEPVYQIAENLVSLGADRVMIGTVAVKQPELVEQICSVITPECVVISVDARNGYLASDGWTNTSNLTTTQLVSRLSKLGAVRQLFQADDGETGRCANLWLSTIMFCIIRSPE